MTDTTTTNPPRKLTLNDLPLVAYRLGCGHDGKERAIRTGDTLFCPPCGQLGKVTSLTN